MMCALLIRFELKLFFLVDYSLVLHGSGVHI